MDLPPRGGDQSAAGDRFSCDLAECGDSIDCDSAYELGYPTFALEPGRLHQLWCW